MDEMEDNFRTCLDNLRASNFSTATSRLYPVSKKLSIFQLDTASAQDVALFAMKMSNVVTLMAEKTAEVAANRNGLESYRFLLTDAYRILRNSCAANRRVQQELGGPQGTAMVTSSGIIADAVLNLFSGESQIQVLAVIIQFLNNLCVNVEPNQDLVWDHFRPKLRTWMDMVKAASETNKEGAVKILNVACSVVEVCLPRQWQRSERFMEDFDSQDIMKAVIQASSIFNFEFRRRVMSKVVQVPNVLKRLMQELSFHERISVCMFLKEVINEWRDTDEQEPANAPKLRNALLFIAETVIMARPALSAERLAQPMDAHMFDMQLHVQMLDVLGVASCCTEFSPHLSSLVVRREDNPRTLVDYAIGLLKDVHEIGKNGPNMLSMVRNRDMVDPNHPSFQLRKYLVRLIGNLAHENKAVQDQVRRYENCSGLAVILEQTMIDERNPFLGEWAKLALSNLILGNEESARFVSNMKAQGRVDAKRILEDCGLVVETDGDRIKIKAEGPQPSLRELTQKEAFRP